MGQGRVTNAERTFAAWVEPIAGELRATRAAIAAFARAAPDELWQRPSPLEEWSCRDLLAHLAGDTGKGSLEAMRAAAEGRAPESAPFAAGANVLNARDVEERRGCSVEDIVAEIEADGEVWQDLLSRLEDSDESVRWPGFPWALGEYLRILAEHDRDHLAELRTALEVAR